MFIVVGPFDLLLKCVNPEIIEERIAIQAHWIPKLHNAAISFINFKIF